MSAGSAGTVGVVLVAGSARCPPGAFPWPAWQVLRSGPVVVVDLPPGHAQALRAAGVDAVDGPLPLAGTVLGPAVLQADLAARGVAVRVVAGPVELPGARLLDVVALMDRLRSPGGCPWDAEQTHASLRPYLLEEAYEADQALQDGDGDALREELGDVLLQVAFHARLAQEGEPAWSVDDVAGELVDKLVRRHPHVFTDGPAPASRADLERSWEQLKAAEKGRTSVTEGVPFGQPALSLAAKLQRRGSRLGAPLPAYDGPGGELWELVRRCAAVGLDPEQELRAVARRYGDALRSAEQAATAQGRSPAGLSSGEWERLWPAAG